MCIRDRHIYFSGTWWGTNLKILNAYPPENLSIASELREYGNVLLYHHILAIFSRDKVSGYDVTSAEKPERKWDIRFNGSFVDARLYNGKLYVVSRNEVNYYRPCPIIPLTTNSGGFIVKCTSIYHPPYPVPSDTIYTVAVIDPESGNVERSISFIGSLSKTVVYISPNAIYITYPQNVDYFSIMFDFIKNELSGILPKSVIDRIEMLKGYEISEQAKQIELGVILNRYYASLNQDERLKIQNEFSNRFNNYYGEHKREFEQTGIVKIMLGDLSIASTGSVPGRLLNQFSMDEHNGYLRLATTVGRWDKASNDVYVLDSSLNIIGSVVDIGLKERIYAVRFIGDTGYVVTYRETDPFYVLDLSSPEKPELKGELKIEGYSSYLHPISDTLILGIGKEGRKVKLSLFDVSNPAQPAELSRYLLDEYWSDVLSTHHAFLMDKERDVFFIPASKGAYVFSYEGDEMKLVKAFEISNAKRTVYIDHYLYVLTPSKVVVIDEDSWERMKELEIGSEPISSPRPLMKTVIIEERA